MAKPTTLSYCEASDSSPPLEDGTLYPEQETDTGFLVALWASVQKPAAEHPKTPLELSLSEMLQMSGCLRHVDQKLHNFRALFKGPGFVPPSKEEMAVELTELLQAICYLLTEYPTLNCNSIQSATTALISKINGLSHQGSSSENRKRYSEIFRGLDALEISIGNETLEMFVGESTSTTPVERAPHMDDLRSEEILFSESQSAPETKPVGNISVEEADELLVTCEGGVDSALDYAKRWCKYTKDLLNWMDKRINYEIEFAKNITKVAESGKWAINQENFMPLQYIYTLVMENDMKLANSAIDIGGLLQMKKYCQPLAAKKNEIEKWRKEFREQWQKEQKKMHDAWTSMRKAQAQYNQRCEDLEKAKQLSAKVEEEYYQMLSGNPGSSSKQRERRRRYQEEAQVKAQEAEASYKTSVNEANARRYELEKAKERIVSHIRKLIYQGDQVLKEVTLNLFNLQLKHSEKVPTKYQSLSDGCSPYHVGEKYLEFIQRMQRKKIHVELYEFEEFFPSGRRPSPAGKRKNAALLVPSSSGDDLSTSSEDTTAKPLDAGIDPNLRKSYCSDTESIGGSSESRSLDSPVSSPELNDGSLENGLISAPGRTISLSSAAQTHQFRRLRGPSKCRECEAFMVSGLECEECCFTSHKKCLEGLLITCGHKKLPSRTPIFGIDFKQVYRDFPEEVPFIVRKCTSEIENRALGVQGIYRMSGSKARVEKLCQAFENGRSLVELTDHSPHDITSVLKHFLKELPESVVPHVLYDEFMILAKDLQKTGDVPHVDGGEPGQHPDSFQDMRNILCRLPATNYNTVRHIIAHLYRVAERFEDNKMSSNNLGIIFGPTLIRPSPGNDVSMTCLIDSGYQAQIVEFLIVNYERIFGADDLPVPSSFGSESSLQEVCSDGNKDPSSLTQDTPLPLEVPIMESSQSLPIKHLPSELPVTDQAVMEKSPEPAEQIFTSVDTPASTTPALASPEETEGLVQEGTKPELDSSTGAQSRGHFSRQPVKTSRQGPIVIRSVTHSVSHLPGNASIFYS